MSCRNLRCAGDGNAVAYAAEDNPMGANVVRVILDGRACCRGSCERCRVSYLLFRVVEHAARVRVQVGLRCVSTCMSPRVLQTLEAMRRTIRSPQVMYRRPPSCGVLVGGVAPN